MHPLFCEVWAARMAIELADSLTQSQDKLAAVSAIYQRYMDNAQLLNAVEAGTTEEEPRIASAVPAGVRGQSGAPDRWDAAAGPGVSPHGLSPCRSTSSTGGWCILVKSASAP
jgi:hypothetical protein